MSIYGELGTIILEHQDVLSAGESKAFMRLGEINSIISRMFMRISAVSFAFPWNAGDCFSSLTQF